LINHSIEILTQRNEHGIVLLGHKTYHPRFGFQKASLFHIGNEYNVDEEFMMLPLVKDVFDESWKGYIIRYHPCFNEI
jgi:predicted N-acetyltransferase YhbS